MDCLKCGELTHKLVESQTQVERLYGQLNDELGKRDKLLDEHIKLQKTYLLDMRQITELKAKIEIAEKTHGNLTGLAKELRAADFRFPNTESFLLGLFIAAGTTALAARQPDWWLWMGFGVVLTFWVAYKQVKAERRGK